MKKEDKYTIVQELSEQLQENKNFYIADISTLPVNTSNDFRKKAIEKGISIRMVKNTLIKKALEKANIEIEGLSDALVGPSALIFSENVNAPARVIKEFRRDKEKPSVKAAYIEESLYLGDDQIEALISLKSKEELIADVIALLQSPIKNVISGLTGQGQKIAGILKTLSEKEE
ncbi:MAG: 50S ribosomal protein L10 [Bacteroidia bacterium]